MTFTRWNHRTTGAAVGAVLVATLTWWSIDAGPGQFRSGTATTVAATGGASPVTVRGGPGFRVALLFDGLAAEATLSDTPVARGLVGMLPVTAELTDAWGQAKTGQLPRPVPVADLTGLPRTLKPTPGGIYYWPDTATLAIYYDDLGQTVPPPGLVQLGALDTAPASIADAGRTISVIIDWATKTRR